MPPCSCQFRTAIFWQENGGMKIKRMNGTQLASRDRLEGDGLYVNVDPLSCFERAEHEQGTQLVFVVGGDAAEAGDSQ